MILNVLVKICFALIEHYKYFILFGKFLNHGHLRQDRGLYFRLSIHRKEIPRIYTTRVVSQMFLSICLLMKLHSITIRKVKQSLDWQKKTYMLQYIAVAVKRTNMKLLIERRNANQLARYFLQV